MLDNDKNPNENQSTVIVDKDLFPYSEENPLPVKETGVVETVEYGVGIPGEANQGSNDIQILGDYTAFDVNTFEIVIVNNSFTFKWRKGNDVFSDPITMTGLPILLSDGISVNWGHGPGHFVDDFWIVNVKSKDHDHAAVMTDMTLTPYSSDNPLPVILETGEEPVEPLKTFYKLGSVLPSGADSTELLVRVPANLNVMADYFYVATKNGQIEVFEDVTVLTTGNVKRSGNYDRTDVSVSNISVYKSFTYSGGVEMDKQKTIEDTPGGLAGVKLKPGSDYVFLLTTIGTNSKGILTFNFSEEEIV